MSPLAVFFDFDGVIADTENIHIAAWQRTLNGLGWALTDESARRAVEVDDRRFLSEIFEKREIEGGDVEGWVRCKQQLTIALIKDSPRLYPGVKELVGSLRGRVFLGVVSTTWRENILTLLEVAGLADAFGAIIGKEDVAAPKPDPEGYLKALKQAGVRATEAIAIEDSATGLAAARGAQIPTLAVGHRVSQGEWSGDSLFIESLARPKETLAKLGILSR